MGGTAKAVAAVSVVVVVLAIYSPAPLQSSIFKPVGGNNSGGGCACGTAAASVKFVGMGAGAKGFRCVVVDDECLEDCWPVSLMLAGAVECGGMAAAAKLIKRVVDVLLELLIVAPAAADAPAGPPLKLKLMELLVLFVVC